MLDVHVGRPADRRHGDRRRAGVFLLPGQSDLCPRALPRGPRPDRQGLDDAGAVRCGTRSTTISATSTPGRGRCSSRTRRSGFPASAAWRRSSSWPSAAIAYMGIPYFHIDVFRRVFDQFREACHKAGYTAAPEQMGWGVPIYVAETDKQAREEFEPHLWYFVRNLLKGIGLTPPGYTSAKSAVAILKNRELVPGRAEDLGRHRKRRLRHRRQPGDGAAKAEPLSEGAGRRRRI